MREVIFYETVNGKKPVEEFLDSLTSKEAQKVIWVLKLFEDPSFKELPGQFFKKLTNTDDIWEVRIGVKGKAIRILGFFDGNDLVVLAHAIVKKTQKTPKKAIVIAQKRKKDYFSRKGGKR